MNKKLPFSSITITTFFVLSFFVHFDVASAEVTVYDDVTITGKAVKLKALTKGRFFPVGGKLVEFYLDEKNIGSTLSGGDGYAFLEYLPRSTGVKRLKIKKDTDTDEGILLVLGKNDRVLLIEIENSLFVPELQNLFQPAKKSNETLKQLSKRFRIIYLTTLIGVKMSRKWLIDNDSPPSTVLKWDGAEMLTELQEREVNLYAIIGSPAILSEASDIIKKRFSFEETEDGVVVRDWDDLLKQLK